VSSFLTAHQHILGF